MIAFRVYEVPRVLLLSQRWAHFFIGAQVRVLTALFQFAVLAIAIIFIGLAEYFTSKLAILILKCFDALLIHYLLNGLGNSNIWLFSVFVASFCGPVFFLTTLEQAFEQIFRRQFLYLCLWCLLNVTIAPILRKIWWRRSGQVCLPLDWKSRFLNLAIQLGRYSLRHDVHITSFLGIISLVPLSELLIDLNFFAVRSELAGDLWPVVLARAARRAQIQLVVRQRIESLHRFEWLKHRTTESPLLERAATHLAIIKVLLEASIGWSH